MAGEPVIDLGVLVAEPARVRAGARWRLSRRRRREILVWSTVALLVAVLAGSRSELGRAVSVPVPASGRFEVVGELLFAATGLEQVPEQGDAERLRSSVDWTAYDLSTGEPLWTLSGMGERLGLVATDGLLWDGGFALDPATGDWLSPEGASVRGGYQYLGVPGGETLIVSGGYRPYSDSAVDVEFSYQVMGVDARTGVVRWRDEPDPGVRVWLTGDPARVVTISSDELVSVRDPDTGAVLASRRIASATAANLIGDQLLVRVWDSGGAAIRSYAWATMSLRWESPEPAGLLERCGPMLCSYAAADSRRTVFDDMSGDAWAVPQTTEVIDPATGAPAWTTTHRLYPVGERFLSYDATGVPRAVVDARSGRPLRDLTGWLAVVPPASAGYPAGDRAVTLMRADPAAGHTQVARLDPVTGELAELGRLPVDPVRCQPYSDGVVCLYADRIWVWPL